MAKGDGSDDNLIFANLMKVLDDGEAAYLAQLRISDPSLTYAQYWRRYVEGQERWNSGNVRQSLENLRLD